MFAAKKPETAPPPAPEALQESADKYYRHCNEVGELQAVQLQALGTPLHAICMISAGAISAAMATLSRTDPEAAASTGEELATGLLNMLAQLGIAGKAVDGPQE
jgi:hypothetical protein